jgi:hypothetical protein
MTNSPYTYDPTEFFIGKDDLSQLNIRDSGVNGFHYFYAQPRGLVKHFVLEVRPRVMTLCEVTLIKKGDKFTPRLRLWKKSRQTGKQAALKANENIYKSIKAAVALDDCHENFWLLIDFLQGIKDIDIPPKVFSLIQATDKAFVDRVLSSFNTSEARQLLIEAKKDDVKNLYAAVRHATNKKALDELQELITEDATELRFQAWFEHNTWAFGVEYLKIYKTSRIGIHSDSDFIAQSLDEYADLIELKRPNMLLLAYDASHKDYYPSSDLSKAMGQAVNYLQAMENSRGELQEQDGITVLKPRIKIIAGMTNTFTPPQKKALRLINNGLHGIEIISYDQVVSRAQKLIDIFSPVIEDSAEE